MSLSAFEGLERNLGPAHPETLVFESNYAVLLVKRGDLAEAEEILAALIPEMERVLDEDNPQTSIARDVLAWTYKMQGEVAVARALFEKNLEIQTRVLGPVHQDTILTQEHLGEVLGEQGDLMAG